MKTIHCVAAVAIAGLLLLTGCGIRNQALSPKNERTKTFAQSAQLQDGVTVMEAGTSVGDMTVGYGSNQAVELQANVKANHGISVSDSNELLDLTDFVLSQAGGKLTVAVQNRKTHTDMWKWIKANRPNTDYSVDLQLIVPQTLHVFRLNTKVGDIRTEALSGVVNAQADVGDVDVENSVFSGNSVLQARVGDVDCGFMAALAGNGTLKLRSDVGDVKIRTQDGTLQSRNETTTVTGAALSGTLLPGLSLDASSRVGDVSVSKY
ncbi:MAG: DUF4097 family beta strand repeat-containing protein [Ethanoligenens sp.]